MKKLLLVLAIGMTVVACNNGGGDKPAGDSTAVTPDTVAPAPIDTTHAADTSHHMPADTSKH
jgi:hypothetical protein